MHEQDYIQYIYDMIKEYDDMSLYVFNIEPEATQCVMKSITHAIIVRIKPRLYSGYRSRKI